MIKSYSLLMVFFLSVSSAFAADVNQGTAVKKAQQLMKARINTFDTVVKSVKTVSYEGHQAYHIVQFAKGGWALISADDMSAPLIGYSDEGVYQTEGLPENEQGMMDIYCQQIARNAKLKGVKPHEGWEGGYATRTVTRATSKISPLITVNWNQTGAYQKYCPKDSKGQAVVGCVAVGMAQAMSVAKWPVRPTGTYGYNSETYGYLSINYDNEPDYDWTAILTGANNKDEVARLLYHCGVAVNMDYGVDGSGTQTSYVPNALRRNFGYPASVRYYTRSSYSGNWEDLIITELQEGRAVAYSGHDPVKNYGHCFNLDGYDGQWFHVNWGWGGSNNGYFGLDGLRDKTMDMDYTDGQGVVVGVRAPSELPSDITLSSTTVKEMQPVGTVVGTVSVESEATDPTYTFQVKGEYSVIFHTNLPAPFEVQNGQLVTTESLSAADYSEGINIEITATNTKNQGSVTRHFTIQVTSTSGISEVGQNDKQVVSETYYTAAGERLDSPVKGINIVRRKLSDGSVIAMKVINK